MAKNTALAKVNERGLKVSAEEAASHPWDHADLLLANAMVNGATSAQDLAQETGLSVSTVRERLLDPIRCAWLSREVREAIGSRIGNVLAALYARVQRNGDPAAAKLLLTQFGELLSPVERKVVDHRHLHLDLTKLTEPELNKLIEDTNRKLNRKDAPIDVTSGVGAEGEGLARTPGAPE